MKRYTTKFATALVALLAAQNAGSAAPRATTSAPVCCACACPCCADASTRKPKPKPAPQVPRVMEDNFVSLTFEVSGGYAGVSSQLTLNRAQMFYRPRRSAPATSASWAEAERASLFKVLNTARFPALAGTYRQKGLYDGFNQDTTLMLRDGKTTRTFIVKSYGNRAPKPYYDVVQWLNQWKSQKFAASGQTAPSTIIEPPAK